MNASRTERRRKQFRRRFFFDRATRTITLFVVGAQGTDIAKDE